jgi:glyoxylase-like metal-dependent hydrolase (beta-lactamase superfamily II)
LGKTSTKPWAAEQDTLHPASLSFPYAKQPPPGEAVEVSPGVFWFSTVLPFRLQAINQWLLRDDQGWTMVDSGYPLAEVREQMEAVWGQVLDGLPITRLLVTHHHCDHIGNCRWLCERWGILPTITAGEYEHAYRFLSRSWQEESLERMAFYRRHGLPEDAANAADEQWRQLYFRPLPEKYLRLQDGDVLRIGGTDWHVISVHGHAPEQAVLYGPARGLLISGDQVLPRITPNVSVHAHYAEADPLAEFLESNRRLAETCGNVLVLPSHKVPFTGLHARIRQLSTHHEQRLAKVEAALNAGPQTAAAVIPAIFGEVPDGHEVGFALGEAIAHLHRLRAEGRVKSTQQNGQVLFERA